MTKHTPGPWILNTEPTSCEGVNVRFDVSSNRRVSIASGQSQEHMSGIDEEECKANARLIAAAPCLLSSLQEAAATLRRYESLHLAKGTEDSNAKAVVNAELAARFEAAIAKATEAA
jgi:hypothetical protein